jgi:hypothetical protein
MRYSWAKRVAGAIIAGAMALSMVMGVSGTTLPANFMVKGENSVYRTTDSHDSPTECSVVVTDYTIIASDGQRAAVEGREWRVARFRVSGDDFNVSTAVGCYYNDFSTPSKFWDETSNGSEGKFNVIWNGAEHETTGRFSVISNAGGVVVFEYSLLVPTGYDGAIVALYNAVHPDTVIDGDTLLFRLDGTAPPVTTPAPPATTTQRPANTDGNPSTGITFAVVPLLLTAGVAVVTRKRKIK